MNIYLLQLLGKWLSLLIISIASFFGSIVLNEKTVIIDNINENKNISFINTLVDHTTITKYNYKLPYNTKKIVVEGEDGVVYKDEDGNIQKVIKEMVPQEVEIGRGPYGNYIGRMTGYGPDCKGCSKVGNVACRTVDKKVYSLIKDGIYYEDEEYGKIRILAAATSKFSCGTIIEVDNGVFEPFIGIVLDTGIAMRNAWKNNEILIDLAFATEKDPEVHKATSKNVKYNVKRWGW